MHDGRAEEAANGVILCAVVKMGACSGLLLLLAAVVVVVVGVTS